MCAKNVHKPPKVSTWKRIAVVAGGVVAMTFATATLPTLVENIRGAHPDLKPDKKGKVVVNMTAEELSELTGKEPTTFELVKKAKAEEPKIEKIPYAEILKLDIESDKYRGTDPETGIFDKDDVLGRMDHGYPFKCDGKTDCAYTQRVVVTTAENEKIVAILAIGDILIDDKIVHGTFLTFKITDAEGNIVNMKALDLREFANKFKKSHGISMYFGNIVVEKGFDKRDGEYHTFYIVGEEVPGERIKPNSFMIGFSYNKNKITGGGLAICMRE